MRVFVVTESDYDNTWIVAVYPTREMADEHERLMGGCVEECDVLDALHPDATDPEKQRKRAEEQQRWEGEQRRYRENQAASAKRRKEVRPNPPFMRLCSCRTFSTGTHFINEHGHCGYCGGFTPEVFREHMGEAALHHEIDKLEEHRRLKMRELVSSDSDGTR